MCSAKGFKELFSQLAKCVATLSKRATAQKERKYRRKIWASIQSREDNKKDFLISSIYRTKMELLVFLGVIKTVYLGKTKLCLIKINLAENIITLEQMKQCVSTEKRVSFHFLYNSYLYFSKMVIFCIIEYMYLSQLIKKLNKHRMNFWVSTTYICVYISNTIIF